jgi:hypothetical protein
MALTIRQQIASIENQLAILKDRLDEEENGQEYKERTFNITFKYVTTNNHWVDQDIRLDAETIYNRLEADIEKLANLLSFADLGEKFDLVSVVEPAT